MSSRGQYRRAASALVFIGYWLLIFLLYLPTRRAGLVADFPGLYSNWQHYSFIDYLNREWSSMPGLYHFTQFITWCYFGMAGASAIAWHLLHVSLHAVNALLLYHLLKALLEDAGHTRSLPAALLGGLLFCISPYAAEPVVWEPSYHYLQGLTLLLAILLLLRRHLLSPRRSTPFIAGGLFLLSCFSLELFYITPMATVLLLIYLNRTRRPSRRQLRNTALSFLLPQAVMFGMYFIVLNVIYYQPLPRGSGEFFQHPAQYVINPAKSAYHLLVFGRFHPSEWRNAVYHFLDSTTGIVIAYLLLASILAMGVFCLRKGNHDRRPLIGFLLFFAVICLAGTAPLWFEEKFMGVCDRYLYFSLVPYCMLLATLLSYIKKAWLYGGLSIGFFTISVMLLIRMTTMWQNSERIVNGLLHVHPPFKGRTVVLLNVPQIYNGLPMIGAGKVSNYKTLHNILLPDAPIEATVLDASAYNMSGPQDGAHVLVVNDSTLTVTLNQWGTWWWYDAVGATSYETPYYRLEMKNPGHYYDLVLKQPRDSFLFLFQQADQWKVVDWNKRGIEQY